MKKAIRVPGTLTPDQISFSRVMKEVWKSPWGRRLVDEPEYGHGDIATINLPDFLIPCVEICLSRLGESRSREYTIRSKNPETTLIFGRGSVPTHDDYMTGMTLLSFLGGFHPTDFRGTQSNEWELFNEGEFYAGGGVTCLKVGESLIFDDREQHSWMHNAGWVFMSAAVKVGR